jgi:hypothetical protein
MSTDLVNVAVPREYLTQVYRLIAELDHRHPDGSSSIGTASVPSDLPNLEWTPARIRKMVDQSDDTMRDILKALATHPGEWLSIETLAQAIKGKDADWNTVAGALGAFGRRLKSRYGLESKPYERRYEHGVGKVLQMSREMAQQVLQALNNGD